MRFQLIGGFLGAGKTTTLARLARWYQQQGLRVGLVTNDQAADLVDTHMLRAQGFTVSEVAGACFCCKFNDLMETVQQLDQRLRPDLILAEPVGSCTDLVSTVLQPLKHFYNVRFRVAPYAVLLKPHHGLKILRGETNAGFSPKAAYILRKQLEEADVIVINRIDELTHSQLHELEELIRHTYPATPVLRMSARTGVGFEALAEFLQQEGDFGRKVLDIDYDTYAEGEAELGWMNSTANVVSEHEFWLDEVLLGWVSGMRERLQAAGWEAAHCKAIGLWEGFYGVANLVANGLQPELSLASRSRVTSADIVLNARVACDPADLQRLAEESLQDVAQQLGLTVRSAKTQSFRPGRPQPTFRLQPA
ncbi:MAG: hypothetical protein KatS3mg113_1042 [Planctomycetaceae bacterium]|nr:MAG: hypothetical protein KatS3mg113_1042 [Planctomycetaceae bacterium]